MRRAIGVAALVVLAACSGTVASGSPSSSGPAIVEPSTGSPTPPPGTAAEPTGVPSDVPPSFADDVDGPDVPPAALVPPGADVSDVWYADTASGSSILVTYTVPSADPFRQERGLVVWRRFPGAPTPWRPVFGVRAPASRGVLQIRAIVGDATGDGSPDALVFEDTGGSGACGTWRVLDLTANAEVFTRKTCDTTIDLSTDPTGLTVREAVFGPEDAHCCPSAMRTSILTYDDRPFAWTTVSVVEEPA